MRSKLFTLLFVFVSIIGNIKSQSIFEDGEWYKIAVTKSGIYKLDKTYLENIGVDVSDPTKIAVFGGDAKALPQQINQTPYLNPEEIPTFLRTDNSSNNFAILFKGEDLEAKEVGSSSLEVEKNIYSDSVFYFITVLDQPVERISFSSLTEGEERETIKRLDYYEKEEINLHNSGRIWLSDRMTSLSPIAEVTLHSESALFDGRLNYDIIGSSSTVRLFFDIEVNGEVLTTLNTSRTNSGYGIKARSSNGFVFVPKELIGEDGVLNVRILMDDRGNNNAVGYVNYLSFEYDGDTRSLVDGDVFYNYSGSRKIELEEEVSDHVIWGFDLSSREQTLISINEEAGIPTSYLPDGEMEFILTDLNKVEKEPIYRGRVENNNIKNVSVDTEFLIVYHSIFQKQVEEYAELKESQGIKTTIAEVSDIYDNYSNGKCDISAIRNHAKYVYDESDNLQFLLLFGDCSYDYKDRLSGNTNFIPVYQSVESYHDVETYSSDDFYGFMDETDGAWLENINGSHLLNISVGRFPVRDTEEAEDIVQKMTKYTLDNDPGKWKNRIMFIADDGDATLHTSQANTLTDLVSTEGPSWDINKVYLDTYEREGKNIPQARDEVISTIEDGVAIVNFTGHGTEFLWAEEEIFNVNDIKQLTNGMRLPVFVTATCEFGRYDDPNKKSGAEELLIRSENGALALVTTTRPVYSSSNFAINTSFYNVLLSPESTGKSLGTIFAETKNQSLNGVFNRNFSLLGDPSIVLRLPTEEVVIETINEISPEEFNDTLNPGETILLKGYISDLTGNIDDDFTGTLEVELFDEEQVGETIGFSSQETIQYKIDPSLIYSASVEVVNGEFELELSIPIYITYFITSTTFTFYAATDDGVREASGYHEFLSIGGEIENSDNLSPEIIINISDAVENGEVLAQEVKLEINFKDDYGILLNPEVIGKEVLLILDGDIQNPIILNDSIIIESSSKNVNATVTLEDLTVGEHTVEIIVWDIHGNVTSKEIILNTGQSREISVSPNPLENELKIEIKETILGQPYTMDFSITDPSGEILFEQSEKMSGNNFVETFGLETSNFLHPGVYYYTLRVRYEGSIEYFEEKGKLVKF